MKPLIYFTIITVQDLISRTGLRNTCRNIYIYSRCRLYCIYLLPSNICYHFEVTPDWHCYYATRVFTNVRITHVYFIQHKTFLMPVTYVYGEWTISMISNWQLELHEKCSEIFPKIPSISLHKMHFKIMSAKWRPFRCGHNVLQHRFSMPNVLK